MCATTKRLAQALALLASVLGPCALAQVAAAGEPTLEGTWVLDHRVMPVGRTRTAPDVIGVMTFIGGLRNMNVYWDADGKPSSISLIVRYKFDASQYAEDGIFYASGIDGAPIVYDTKKEHGSSPVTTKDGKSSWQFPLYGKRSVEITAEGLTARGKDFVDHWKRVH